jgi:WD40 repeat protein
VNALHFHTSTLLPHAQDYNARVNSLHFHTSTLLPHAGLADAHALTTLPHFHTSTLLPHAGLAGARELTTLPHFHTSTLLPHTQDYNARVNSLDFHRSEDLLITASDDDSIRLFNTSTGERGDVGTVIPLCLGD